MASFAMPKFSNFVKAAASASTTPLAPDADAPIGPALPPSADKDSHFDDGIDSSKSHRDKHKSHHKHKRRKREHDSDHEASVSSKKSKYKEQEDAIDDPHFASKFMSDAAYSIRRVGDFRSYKRGGINSSDKHDYQQAYKGALGASENAAFLWSPDQRSYQVVPARSLQYALSKSKDDKKSPFEGRYCEKGATVVETRKIQKKTPGELAREEAQYGPFVIPVSIDPNQTEVQSISEQQEMEGRFMARNRELSSSLVAEPNNIALWLDLVRLQDEYASLITGSYRKQSISAGRTSRVVLEKKLEIYKRALEKNPGQVDLLVGKLEVVNLLYGPKEANEAWSSVLADENTDLPALWLAYIKFVQSHFTSFSIERFRTVYTSAIRYLNRSRARNRDEVENIIADILVRAALVEHQAGYTERAVALYQGLIEINFNAPEHVKTAYEKAARSYTSSANSALVNDLLSASRTRLLSLFQAFWDSGLPRFGERDAKGWNRYFLAHDELKPSLELYDPLEDESEERESRMDVLQGFTHSQEFEVSNKTLDQRFSEDYVDDSQQTSDDIPDQAEELGKWIKAERVRAQGAFQVKRPTDMDDDMNAIVLFEDIKDALFYFSQKDIKYMLLTSFLDLLGVFVANTHESTNSALQQAKILEEEYPENLFDFLNSVNFPAMASVDTQPGEDANNPISAVFALPRFLDFLDSHISPQLAEEGPRKMLARLALEQGTGLVSETGLLTKTNLNVCRILLDGSEMAKQLLSVDPENVALWNAFMTTSVPVDTNPKKRNLARKQLAKTIQTFLNNPRVAHTLQISTLMEYHNGDYLHAMEVLLSLQGPSNASSSASQNSSGPSRIEIAQADYARRFAAFSAGLTQAVSHTTTPTDTAIFFDSLETYFNLTICCAMLELLIQGIDSFLQVFSSAIAHLRQCATVNQFLAAPLMWCLERLYMFELDILAHEYQRKRPGVANGCVRKQLFEALENFPSNRYVLALFALFSQRTLMLATSRRYFDTLLFSPPTSAEHDRPRLLSWLFAARSEIRLHAGQRINHLVESSLAAECRADVYNHQSIVLWKMALQLEISVRGSKKRAIGLLYRAIRSCPWAKTLWMDYLEQLRFTLQPNDIGDILSLLNAKEVRLFGLPRLNKP